MITRRYTFPSKEKPSKSLWITKPSEASEKKKIRFPRGRNSCWCESVRNGQARPTEKGKEKKKKRKKEKNGEFKSNRRNVNFCQASRIQLHPCGTVVLSIRSGRAALRRLVTLENTICVTWKTVRLEVDSWNGKTRWSIDRLIAVHRRDDRSIDQFAAKTEISLVDGALLRRFIDASIVQAA